MSAAATRKVVEAWWHESMVTMDLDRSLEYFSDDVIYEDYGLCDFLEGREQTDAFWREFYGVIEKDTFACPIHRIKTTDDGGYTVEWTATQTLISPWRGMGKPGQRFQLPGVSVGEVVGDKITVNRDYYNVMVVLAQLGITELPQA